MSNVEKIDRVKTVDEYEKELNKATREWVDIYEEKEKYKALANQLLTTIKTMQSIHKIEKELS